MATQREITISLPEPIVQAATALAAQESRTVGEFLGDRGEQYERSMRWKELRRYGQERAAAMGYTEEDVVRICREVRAEQHVPEQPGSAGTQPK